MNYRKNPDNCLHGHTRRYSESLNLDKCHDCGNVLVWCILDGKGHTHDRHWHAVDGDVEAIHLARAIETTAHKRAEMTRLQRAARGLHLRAFRGKTERMQGCAECLLNGVVRPHNHDGPHAEL